jgi:hypothetical protein
LEDREPCAQTQEIGRGRPSYEEASDDATTNTDPAVDPTHHSNIPSFQDSSLCRSCQTKPNEVSGGKCQVSSEQSQSPGTPGLPTSDFPLQTADAKRDVTSQPG